MVYWPWPAVVRLIGGRPYRTKNRGWQMKTSMVVTCAFLMSSAIPVFAQTHQQTVTCHWSADNSCFLEEKIQAIGNGSPEGSKTAAQMQEDIKAQLHGSAYIRSAAMRSEAGSPEMLNKPEQRQEEVRARLHG